MALGTPSVADEASSEAPSVRFMEKIVVTSQKKSVGESVQDVPVAMTVVSDAQLESLNFRSLRDIAIISPNASLETNDSPNSHTRSRPMAFAKLLPSITEGH